jgi:hypothetical protein
MYIPQSTLLLVEMTWHYWTSVFLRAARETYQFIWGLSRGAIFFAILIAATYLALAYYTKGREEAGADLEDQLLLWISPLLWFPVFYIVQLVRVPPVLSQEQHQRSNEMAAARDATIAAQEQTIKAIQAERPLHFIHANINIADHALGFEIHYENIGDRLLSYAVRNLWAECAGRRYFFSTPISETMFARPKMAGYYLTGATTEPIAAITLPTQIVLNFDIEYDNVPPLCHRVTGRTVQYHIQVIGPIPNSASVFLAERES